MFASVVVLFLMASFHDVTAEKKNVLMIVSDDLRPNPSPFTRKGWTREPENLHTPNIQRLADEGVTFQRAYCQQAICGPSRTSFMTGRRPDTTGVIDNDPYWRDSFPDMQTFPQYLQSVGYTTAGVGKIFHSDYGTDYDNLTWSIPFMHPEMKTFWKSRFGHNKSHAAIDLSEYARKDLMDREIVDNSKELLQEFKEEDKLFYLAVGFKLPHLPWLAPQEYFELFPLESITSPDNEYLADNSSVPDAAYFPSTELLTFYDVTDTGFTGQRDDYTLTELDPTMTLYLRQAYYASMAYVDSLVGELLDKLDALGLADSTSVIFMSDHGYSLGEHKMWNKNTNFEVTNHVPLIIKSANPDHNMEAGRSTEELVELVDIFPTVLELAGVDQVDACPSGVADSASTSVCRDGMSLVPLLSSDDTWTKKAAFHQFKRGNKMGYSMYHKHDNVNYHLTMWLYYNQTSGFVKWSNIQGHELYNLDDDPEENANIYEDDHDNPDLLTDLFNILETGPGSGWNNPDNMSS